MINDKDVWSIGLHRYGAEASSIGLEPGQWPPSLPTTLGNGQPFVRTAPRYDEQGDLLSVTYRQAMGCISLSVLND